MTNPIVTVNVTSQSAPAPSTLQRTGAFISQGATTLPPGTTGLLTQTSDLTPILTGVLALSNLVWASSVVTATTAAPHGFTTGDTIVLAITGAVPAGYNVTKVCTITGASTFTYNLTANPGTASVFGSYAPEDVAELVAMTTTWFAQGAANAVYVLELGAGSPADGVTALTAWLNANPKTIYSFLTPRAWAGESTFLALVADYENLTSLTKFFVTATTGNYTNFTDLMDEVFVLVEAPGIPAIEFSCAAPFWASLNYQPSASNMVTPLAFSYLYGVTPYPLAGNGALFAAFKAAHVNWVGTGAVGGITTAILYYGTMMDGKPFNYGYSIDWADINLALNLSNAIINGSNNPQAPLYYNQQGINTLQAVAQQTLTAGITFGLFLGPLVVNAVPFYTYTQQNPGAYAEGSYNGLSASVTPQGGFISIVFNLNVTDFVTG